MTKVSLNNY